MMQTFRFESAVMDLNISAAFTNVIKGKVGSTPDDVKWGRDAQRLISLPNAGGYLLCLFLNVALMNFV
jgi:hypothetical protein